VAPNEFRRRRVYFSNTRLVFDVLRGGNLTIPTLPGSELQNGSRESPKTIPADRLTSGIIYDDLRLELDDAK
jgi:hypothetical protein